MGPHAIVRRVASREASIHKGLEGYNRGSLQMIVYIRLFNGLRQTAYSATLPSKVMTSVLLWIICSGNTTVMALVGQID